MGIQNRKDIAIAKLNKLEDKLAAELEQVKLDAQTQKEQILQQLASNIPQSLVEVAFAEITQTIQPLTVEIENKPIK